MNEKSSENYNVPGLEKGLEIIETLIESRSAMTLNEITKKVNVTVTTAFRIMSTLVRMEYVSFNEIEKSYKLTRKLLRMGYRTIGEFDTMEKVVPILKELRDKVKESVFFGILGEDKGVFIEQAPGLYPFKYVLTPGSTFELHISAAGKIFLAYSDRLQQDAYISRMSFDRYTPNTITNKKTFVQELTKVKKLGYATDIEESMPGVICIGAPVFDYESKVVGAIWVSGPNVRLQNDVFDATLTELLSAAQKLSCDLGFDSK